MGGIGAKVWLGGVWVVLATVACAAKPMPVATPTATKPDPNAEIVRYCAGTVTEWDEHRCIWELTPEQQRHRSYGQRLTSRAAKLVRFDTITGSGSMREDSESAEYDYDGHSIRSWSNVNRNGVVKGNVTVSESGDWVRWLDAQGRPRPKSGSTVSGLRRSLDARGRVLGYVYVDAAGNPARYSGDVFEKRVKLNQAGAVVEETFFGQRGEAVLGPAGAHRVSHQVDAHGLELERRYFDTADQPMLVKGGVGIVRSRYDGYGNPIETAYFALDGRPVVDPDDEAAIVRKTRDERGNEIELQRFDELGKPAVYAPHGSRRKTRYDENDSVLEVSYFDADGAPTRPSALGYAIKRQTRDARGNVISESYFDENAKAIMLPEGYHGLRIAYDARDNPIAYSYTDAAGTPVVIKQGYQARRLTYDGDRVTRTDFLDQNANVRSSSTVSYAADGSESQAGPCQGTVPQDLVTAISARAATASTCYERLLASSPDAAGKLLVGMRIEPDGKVSRVSMIEDELGDVVFASCVRSKLMRDLPRGPENGCAEVNVPLKFQPKKRDETVKP